MIKVACLILILSLIIFLWFINHHKQLNECSSCGELHEGHDGGMCIDCSYYYILEIKLTNTMPPKMEQ